MPWVKMSDEDRARFGGPEWVNASMEPLKDMLASELHAIEVEMDFSVGEMVRQEARQPAWVVRAQLWIGRKVAGVEEAWDDFDPHILQLTASVVDPTLGDTPDGAGNGSSGQEQETATSPDFSPPVE